MSKKNTKPPVKKPAAEPQTSGKSKLNFAEIFRVAAILTAICIVMSAALAGVNMLTEQRIAEIAKENEYATCREVFAPAEGQELTFTSLDEICPEYGVSGYVAADNGSPVGCVIISSAKGYGGDVEIMVGFDMERTITGVSILSHSETPGLGANAAKPGFLGQFTGSTDAGSLAVVKDGGTVDAVTAATISSRAVTGAVNSAADSFDLIIDTVRLVRIDTPAADLPVSAGDAAVSGSDTASGSDAANTQQGGAE